MTAWLSGKELNTSVEFVSLGMVVIDEIRLPSRPPIIDVAGGSGSFSTLGYRLLTGRSQSRRVGCLVRAGTDFPEQVKNQLSEWQLTLEIQILQHSGSTRGLLVYEDSTFGPKNFHYTTPPLKTRPEDVANSLFLNARAFHFLATPQEVLSQVHELIALRANYGIKTLPFILWEPFPAACTIKDRPLFLEACSFVDVFSPNHLEISAMFEEQKPETFRPEALEKYALEISRVTGANQDGVVIVRAGEHGSLTIQGMSTKVWLPPFYLDGSKEVVDPTGAGNAFLGGYTAGWLKEGDMKEASIYGAVAASFAVEQIGLPTLHPDELELWNGVRVQDRLALYKARVDT
ncbi:putative PfkB family kinase [Ophiobolus disseminans]|uniref:Putative PfkB family kinase n=1 Tax=Ophiobolus disseminans TaxID=1469910 RepID=A0A6A7AGH3_9PLEO|nr:putative PfkB family kinase [Ophiobolus disseminans]